MSGLPYAAWTERPESIAGSLASGVSAGVSMRQHDATNELEKQKLAELVRKARMDEMEKGYSADEAGGVRINPNYYTEGTPEYLHSDREAALKAKQTQKAGGALLTADQYNRIKQGLGKGQLDDDLKSLQLSPSYGFGNQGKPVQGFTPEDAETLGVIPQGSAAKLGGRVIPTGALAAIKPKSVLDAGPGLVGEYESYYGEGSSKNMAPQDMTTAVKNERDRAAKAQQAKDKLSLKKKDVSPGQKVADTKAAEDRQNLILQGGGVGAQAEIDKLKAMGEDLSKRDYGFIDKGIGVLPKRFRDVVDPGLGNTEDMVKKQAMKTMKATFGGRVAIQEMQNLLDVNWNPRMSPQVNAARIHDLIKEMEASLGQRTEAAKYFESHDGSMEGYNPISSGRVEAMRKSAPPETKIIGGKTYQKFPQGWKEIK